jgi:methionyl-tRNA formyltransferase
MNVNISKTKILVATIKSWNIKNALEFKEKYREKYEVMLITAKEKLNFQFIKEYNPDYIFFPHWSWIIPEEIYDNFDCIVFHMTDLPFGRGGSPLQNLILRKIYSTKITAIHVEKGFDTGKIYLKENFFIGLGSAEEIFIEASKVIFRMIYQIVDTNPAPVAQSGDEVQFKRRTPDESDMSRADIKNFDDLFDFIRMLDGEGYPNAFLNLGKFKITFLDVHKKEEKLTGRFKIVYEE